MRLADLRKKCSVAVTPLILLWLSVSPARANQVIFLFNSPSGSLGSSQTYTVSGLSITATGYRCVGASGGLCANDPNTNYSADLTNLYDNSDGLGIANNVIGSEREIPNSEFVQIDFSSVIANHSVQSIQSIQYKMTDIVTAWSSYGSTTAGELKGTNGATLVTNSSSTATQTITSPAFDLYSFIAGTNCDVVLNEVIINYTPTTAPEPGYFGLIGISLTALAIVTKKIRGKR